jgi:hypothetical protein
MKDKYRRNEFVGSSKSSQSAQDVCSMPVQYGGNMSELCKEKNVSEGVDTIERLDRK